MIVKLVLSDGYRKTQGDINVACPFKSAWDRGIRNAIVSWHLHKRGSEQRLLGSLAGCLGPEDRARLLAAKDVAICRTIAGYALFLDRDVGALEVALQAKAVHREDVARPQDLNWRNACIAGGP